MSSELLAELDSYYRSQQSTSSITADSSSEQGIESIPNTGGDDLIAVEGQKKQKPVTLEPIPGTILSSPIPKEPLDVEWGLFEESQAPNADGQSRPALTNLDGLQERHLDHIDFEMDTSWMKSGLNASQLPQNIEKGGISAQPNVPSTQSKMPPKIGVTVLFDADQEPQDEEDDGFGEFESGTLSYENMRTAPESQSTTTQLADPGSAAGQPQVPEYGLVLDSGQFKHDRTPMSTLPNIEEPWDQFQAALASQPASGQEFLEQKGAESSRQIDVKSKPNLPAIPPTNIPPPALLLSLFPPLFVEVQKRLDQSLTEQSLHKDEGPHLDPAYLEYLDSHLLLARVAGRIIGGRKLRWKRDNLLSQGMRIGPASSKKSTGMKLATVDKAESSREEREVLDVLETWGKQVGRLRSAVAAVNADRNSRSMTVPKLQESIPIRTARETEGAIPSPRPCALCGLKRNERVIDVDEVDLQDAFDEYWIERLTMHRDCIEFFATYKDKLRSR